MDIIAIGREPAGKSNVKKNNVTCNELRDAEGCACMWGRAGGVGGGWVGGWGVGVGGWGGELKGRAGQVEENNWVERASLR